jgi:hypothetical protein
MFSQLIAAMAHRQHEVKVFHEEQLELRLAEIVRVSATRPEERSNCLCHHGRLVRCLLLRFAYCTVPPARDSRASN